LIFLGARIAAITRPPESLLSTLRTEGGNEGMHNYRGILLVNISG